MCIRNVFFFRYKAEIKRLKAANRAASYERRLLLMQQEEIARLRKNTKKIRDKATTEQTTPGQQERGENLTATGQDSGDQVKVGRRRDLPLETIKETISHGYIYPVFVSMGPCLRRCDKWHHCYTR